jgi:hypothetical protein
MLRLSLLAGLVLVAITTAFAEGKPLEPYSSVVIDKFTVDPALLKNTDFPPGYEDVLQKTLLARLLTERIFPQGVDESRSGVSASDGQVLAMDGEVTAFAKGNRAARVAIGYGAGSARMKLVLTFRDVSTGRKVLKLEQIGRYAGFGNLTGGSADQARTEAARKVVDGLLKKIKAAR